MSDNKLNTIKKNRVEYLYELFRYRFNKIAKSGLYSKKKASDSNDYEFFDQQFIDFITQISPINSGDVQDNEHCRELFDFIKNCDPTTNKEYLSWFINIYFTILKNRLKLLSDKNFNGNKFDESLLTNNEMLWRTFFEDILTKTLVSIETHALLKKTNILSDFHRDVNNFKSLNEFNNYLKPYTISDKDDDDDVHTLNMKELMCIRNFTEKNNSPGQAELHFENDDWIIVETHDKLANSYFGKYTTWCTAGNRYSSMFDSYHSRGSLFVLIKKGFGAKKLINLNPQTRLQFHFEDDMYMDANDNAIDISDFFKINPDIKNFFRHYVTNNALNKRLKKVNNNIKNIIDYLSKLGYSDQILDILVDGKIENVDLSGVKNLEPNFYNMLFKIKTIKTLDLSDNNLTALPQRLNELVNLTSLKLRLNKGLNRIDDLSGFKNLTFLDVSGCDINDISCLLDLENLTELILDGNTNLSNLPKNMGTFKNLIRLTASNCNITEVDESIMLCDKLFLVDLHSNNNLSKIPLKLSSLPEIVAICIDETAISKTDLNTLNENSNGFVTIIKYDIN